MNHLIRVVLTLVVALVLAGFVRMRRGRLRLATVWPGLRKDDKQPALGLTGVIAACEVRQRVRGRAFRVATALVLAAVAAAIVIPALTKGSTHPQRLGVVGPISAAETSGISAAARSAGTTVKLVPEPDARSAERALSDGRLDLAVVDRKSVLVHTALSSDDTSDTALLARAVAKTLGTLRAIDAAGLTRAQVADLAAAQPVPIHGLKPADHTSGAKGASVTATILVFVMLSQYLGWTLIGVMQEKSNRVVEVLLATVRPIQLLTGKLLGIGLVVFGQAAVIAGVAFGVGKAVGSTMLHGATPLALVSQFAWLVLGYAFYSWLYAAAGSMVERQDQVQSLAIPLAVPLVFGYIVAISAVGSGRSSTLLDVLAYLPPTAPFAMPVLVALKAVSWWQFAASVLISVAATFAAAKLAAAVYRRAILRTGRRVRFRELRQPARAR